MSTLTVNMNSARQWIKSGEHPTARLLFRLIKGAQHLEMPLVSPIHSGLYSLHKLLRGSVAMLARVFYWTPLFKSKLSGPAPHLYLYGGMPLLLGSLQLKFGPECRVSGQTTFSGRTASKEMPLLKVGKNVDIGWQTTIAVGRRIELGDNVRIAGRAFLAGYPGHPLDPVDRALGLPETEQQVGDIVLEDDVWLATGVSVMAGVRIGQGTVVAAGSVVTHDLPPGVLAGGVPARVIRVIDLEVSHAS